MRVLLDVNVLVRANERSMGSARAVLLALIGQGHTLLICSEMLIELAAVLRYPRLQMHYGLNDEQIYSYIEFLREACEPVILNPQLMVPIRDPKDTAVLQTAVIGEADVICTLDSDFYASDTVAFCATLGIEVLTDVQLLQKLQRNF